MDFTLKQWRDPHEEDDSEDPHPHANVTAKSPKLHHLLDHNQDAPPSSEHHHCLSPLPLFVPDPPTKLYPPLFSSSSSSSPSSFFPRVGGGGCFSWTQWQELELQALIYKHMVAGAAVPPELLLLVKKSLIHSSYNYHHLPYPFQHLCHPFQPSTLIQTGGGYFGRAGMDPEPGRCRRTDGKKWRCSRDVVAGHKYCERHMHRGRNRSRKPVESPAAAATTTVSSTLSGGANGGSGSGSGGFGGAKSTTTTFAASRLGTPACGTQFSLSEAATGSDSIDMFQLNRGTSDIKSDKKTQFEPHQNQTSSVDANAKSSASVLRPFFDDWPRSPLHSDTATHLSISTPGNPSSDFLKLSTGGNNGDHPRRENDSAGGDRDRDSMNWGGPTGWGGGHVGGPMGGPLAEALRSSTSSSPTSVLHQLPRCSGPDTSSFVSA